MTSTLRVTVDSDAVSVAEAIAEAARHVPFLILTDRLFGDLAHELGGEQEATHHLIRVATNTDKPLAVNVEGLDGASTTAIVSPRGWSQDRLRGWIGGRHEELEALFGAATVREDV